MSDLHPSSYRVMEWTEKAPAIIFKQVVEIVTVHAPHPANLTPRVVTTVQAGSENKMIFRSFVTHMY
ncbi:hypothetical protein QCA50_019964 [Cerrena zonata]|uniref:Uncharacterized protein n=1 Tax=Cerrena zonata TaxID=2478898 RepID=A0AAW0F9X7_9APHY